MVNGEHFFLKINLRIAGDFSSARKSQFTLWWAVQRSTIRVELLPLIHCIYKLGYSSWVLCYQPCADPANDVTVVKPWIVWILLLLFQCVYSFSRIWLCFNLEPHHCIEICVHVLLSDVQWDRPFFLVFIAEMSHVLKHLANRLFLAFLSLLEKNVIIFYWPLGDTSAISMELPSGLSTLVIALCWAFSDGSNTTFNDTDLWTVSVGFSATSPPNVIPSPVNMSTLMVSGPWNHFNLSWQPSYVDFGTIYYKLKFNIGSDSQTVVSHNFPRNTLYASNPLHYKLLYLVIAFIQI